MNASSRERDRSIVSSIRLALGLVSATTLAQEKPAPPSEGTGSYTTLPVPEDDALELGIHGYFRAPALLTIRKRAAADQRPADRGNYDYRPPRLIDNDF